MVRKALVAGVVLLSLSTAVAGCGSSRSASVSSDSAPAAPGGGIATAAPALTGPAAAAASAAGAALPLVPEPSQVSALGGPGYRVTSLTAVRSAGGPAAAAVAGQLAAELDASTGLRLPVRTAAGAGEGASSAAVSATGAGAGGVLLLLDPAAGTGAEGYRLASGPSGVQITAADPAGLFHGAQTLRQLLPARGTGTVAAVRIADRPRYPVRSFELDVARHFFPVPVVERMIDLLAEYKFDYLHLHLTDDQGWRIQIPGLPRLTGIGAATEVGGGPGGYYTDADYRAIVAYAAARYVTVVPEVDLPAHTNAALTAYPDLACAGTRRPRPYTGIGGAMDSLCTGTPRTDAFVDQVVGALAAMTPGRYLDIGGDEAFGVSSGAYDAFMVRASAIVRAHGKVPVAWEEAAAAGPGGPALLGAWHPPAQLPAGLAGRLAAAVRGGAQVLLEPAEHAYLDQKYDAGTRLGLDWAGYVGVRQAYDWNPGTFLQGKGVPADSVAGVEATLWTETLSTGADLETMLLPRLPALAEVGWTPQADRVWSGFRLRLAAQAPRWDAQGLAWTRADGVPWR